jgi:hypothetical protein
MAMREQTMTRKELLARKHEEALIKRIVIIALFSFGLIALVFYYAIPTMVKIADIWETTRNSGTANVDDPGAGIPLSRPYFDQSIPTATNSANFVLRGNSVAGVSIHATQNGRDLPEVVADSSGGFIISSLSLSEGANVFTVYAQDTRGKKSEVSQELKVSLDTRAPKLEVSSPNNGDTMSGARGGLISVKGKTDEATQMYVNGGWVILNADGTFDHKIQLAPGENTLTMYAADDSGNKSVEIVRKVTYNP